MTSEVEPINPFASPTTTEPMTVSVDSDDPWRHLPSRGRRLAAAMIDLALLLPGIFVIYVTLEIASGGIPADPIDISIAYFLVGILSIGYYLVLNGYLLAYSSQTIGKWMLGMRIVRMNGTRPSVWRLAFLRFGLFALVTPFAIKCLVVVIDPLLIATPQRRCLHDWLAGTIVVKV